MYCSHFSLQRLPFNNTPDPAFYYSTPDHEEALATLQYAAQQRKGFVLVTGEIGAGKTLIGRIFLRQMDPSATIAVISNTHLNGRQLLAAICSEFGLPVLPESSNLELTQRLQEFLVEQFARDRHVIVLLDEGQNLPEESFEELRMLGNLEADDAKLLQVCILGQPELRDRFRKPSMRQLDQRLFRRFHLAALNRQQTGEYIRHRLNVANAENEGLFTPEAVDRIFAASRGIPRLINQICDNALLTGYGRNVLVIDAEIIDVVLERDTSLRYRGNETSIRASSENAEAACEKLIDPAGSQKLSELALDQTREMTARIGELAAEPEPSRVEVEQLSERQEELRKIVAGATMRWLAAKEKLDAYRREIQQMFTAVTERCDAVQSRVEEVSTGAASAEDVRQLREAHLGEISRVMAALEKQRQDACGQIEGIQKSWAETNQKLTALSAKAASAEALQRLVEQQEQRTTELLTHLDGQRENTQALIRGIEQECRGTQRALDALRESTGRRAEEAERAIEELTATIGRSENDVAVLRQEMAARLDNAHEAIAELEARGAYGNLDEFRAEQQQVRGQQAEMLAGLNRRIDEQSTSLQRFRRVIARHSTNLSRQNRSYLERLAEKLVEQSSRLAAMRSELGELEPQMQRRLDLLADQLKASQSAAQAQIDKLAAGQVTIEEVRAGQRAEVAEVAVELQKQRQMLEDHLRDLIARMQGNESQTEAVRALQATDAGNLRASLKAQRQDLEGLADALERRCDDLRTRIDALPMELSAIEETRQAVGRTAAEIASIRGDLQDYRTRFEGVLAQLSADSDRTRAGLEAVANRTAALEAGAENAASRGDLEALVHTQQHDVSELLKQLAEQRQAFQDQVNGAIEQIAQTRDQMAAFESSTATSADLDALRGQHTQDIETVLSTLSARRKDFDDFAAGIDRRCKEMLVGLQELSAERATREQLQALRDEHAARMATLSCEIEQRGQVFERTIQQVSERCEWTQAAMETLTAQTEATAGQLRDFRDESEQKLSGITHRLDSEHEAHQHEVAELESALSQGVTGLERRIQRVSSEMGQKMREASKRLGVLESSQHAPLRIDLTPEVRNELAELVTAAKKEKEETRAALERASAMTSHLHNTSARVQEVMQQWVEGADEVREQSEQLRASALKAGEILAAMQRCHEILDAKLNSQRWQSELQRGERLTARLEQASENARTASQQLTALLADFDRARGDVDGWTRRQDQAQRLSDRLSHLLAQAEQAGRHIDKTLDGRKRLLGAIAKNTGNLVSMIQSARLDDEERRPTIPPASRVAVTSKAATERKSATSETKPEPAKPVENRLNATRPAIRWPRFQPEPLVVS
jgi:general secretion pathway protein A